MDTDTTELRNAAAADRRNAERACAEHALLGSARWAGLQEAIAEVKAARLGGLGRAGVRYHTARDAWLDWLRAWRALPAGLRLVAPGDDWGHERIGFVVTDDPFMRLELTDDPGADYGSAAGWSVPLKAAGFTPPVPPEGGHWTAAERWQALADYGV